MIDEQFLETIPQYGIGGFVKKFFKNVKKVVKKVAPIVGGGIGFMIGGAAGAGIGSGIGSLIAGKSVEESLGNAMLGYGIGSVAGSFGPFKQFAGKGIGGKMAWNPADKGNLFNIFTGGGTENKIANLEAQKADLLALNTNESITAANQIDTAINQIKVNEILRTQGIGGGGALSGGTLGNVLMASSLAMPALAYYDQKKQNEDWVPADPMGLNQLYYEDPQAYQVAGMGVNPYYHEDLQNYYGLPVADLPSDFIRSPYGNEEVRHALLAAEGGIIKKRHEGSSLRGEFSGSPHTEGPFYRGDDEGTSPNVPYDEMQKDQMMSYLMMQFSENPSAFEQRYGNEMAEFFRQIMGFKTKKQVESDTGAIFDENSSEIIGYNLAQGGVINLADGSQQYFPRKNGQIDGPGTGTSDDIPAMLSDGEFVFTARAVRNAGGGDRREGAKRMYQVMKNLEKGGNLSRETRGVA